MPHRILLFVLGLALLTKTAVAKEKVLMMVVDGLRWDRLGYEFPALDLLEKSGVRAEWTDPVFITVSSPSMMSIATGLYVESHGVLHNQAFDPETKEIDKGYLEGLNSTWWFNGGGEPVWITAMTQGLKAGTFMYPGGQVLINGHQPTRWQVSSTEERTRYGNLTDRVDVIFDWLYGADDLDLVLFHLEVLDNALHAFGFTTLDIAKKEAAKVNALIEYILTTKMQDDSRVGDTLNFILTSDHGMVETPASKKIYLYDYIQETEVDFIFADNGPVFQIKPVDGALETVFNKLNNAHPAMYVYKKETFPERFHYANNARNLPIIGYVDSTWTSLTKSQIYFLAADHGYDNEDMTMKSSFYATGPSFKTGYRAKHFESTGKSSCVMSSDLYTIRPGAQRVYSAEKIQKVNIYPLMCELLGIVPAPNNGSRDNYKDMLISDDTTCSPGDQERCCSYSAEAVISSSYGLHVLWAALLVTFGFTK